MDFSWPWLKESLIRRSDAQIISFTLEGLGENHTTFKVAFRVIQVISISFLEAQIVLCRICHGRQVCSTIPGLLSAAFLPDQNSLMWFHYLCLYPHKISCSLAAATTDQRRETARSLSLACDVFLFGSVARAFGPTGAGLQLDRPKVFRQLGSCLCRGLSCHHYHCSSSSKLCQIVDKTTMGA